MSASRTGVYVEDFLDETSSLPHELQRLLSTMRELDERSQNLQMEIRAQVQECLDMPSLHLLQKGGGSLEQAARVDALRQKITSSQENHVGLCTEKVLLAQQVFDLLDGHEKRLTEDLGQFHRELKQEGKLPSGDTRSDAPLGMSTTAERRKGGHSLQAAPTYPRVGEPRRGEVKVEQLRERDGGRDGARDRERINGAERDSVRETVRDGARERAGQEREREREREWMGGETDMEVEGGVGRERERGAALMPPPPPAQRRRSLPPLPPGDARNGNEPTYCVCGKASFGDMIKCDNENCMGGEWFHYACVGLGPESRTVKGRVWYCPACRAAQQRRRLAEAPMFA